MTTYVVLLPGDESTWEAASEEERQAVFARHEEFSQALERRGHKVTGGAELTHSREARTVRLVDGRIQVTEGPYAETVEQLSGFYVVQSDDLDDLLECTAIIADRDGAIEVRAATPGSEV